MNVLVSGTRGEGKSTLALFLATAWSETVIIFDPRGSYKDVGIQVHTPEALREHLTKGDYIQLKSEPNEQGEYEGDIYPLVYRPDKPPDIAFQEMCDVLFPPYFQGFDGGLALIVDESRELQSSHTIHPALGRVVGQAPIESVLVIQTTHTITEWNNKSRSVMDEMFLFRQIGRRNYDLVSDYCGPQVADIVCNEQFPAHHCVRYFFKRKANGQFEVWDNPQTWYVQLKAPTGEGENHGKKRYTVRDLE